MKYGVIVYRNTDNLGDDIQSYAQIKYLPHVDCYVEREALDTFEFDNEPVGVIMSGWYLKNKCNWPPSKSLYPLFVSTHFSENDPLCIGYDFLEGFGGDYLRKIGPIGTRDDSTLSALLERDIPAYLTGCLTLTIQQSDELLERKGIVLCDISDSIANDILSAFPNVDFYQVTHSLNPAEHSLLSYEERFLQVEKTLCLYQSAKLVITTRLHCALPCLALGTPVLLVNDGSGLDRLGFYFDFVNHCTSEELLSKLDDESWIATPKQNPDKHLKLKENLEQKCRSFFADVESCKMISPYEGMSSVSELAAWQKALITNSEIRRAVRDRELSISFNWNSQKIAQLESSYDELHEWTDQLQSTKDHLDRRLADLEDWARREDEAKHEIERINREELKKETEKLNKEFEKKTEKLNHKVDSYSKTVSDIKHSLSWKIGRTVTKLPRIVRDSYRKWRKQHSRHP